MSRSVGKRREEKEEKKRKDEEAVGNSILFFIFGRKKTLPPSSSSSTQMAIDKGVERDLEKIRNGAATEGLFSSLHFSSFNHLISVRNFFLIFSCHVMSELLISEPDAEGTERDPPSPPPHGRGDTQDRVSFSSSIIQ